MFNLLDTKTDQHNNSDNIFVKLEPRVSLDALFHKDLSFGPVKELYLASLFEVGDNSNEGANPSVGHYGNSGNKVYYVGPGSDVQVPWLGKMGMNLMARYVVQNYGAANEHHMDGYIFDTNWFKPFVHFNNGTFIAYQGYIDQQFGATKLSDSDGGNHANNSTEWFNGFYWHSKRYAVGYGLKYFKNAFFNRDGAPLSFADANGWHSLHTTGFGSYFDFTYKF
jgi:nucleoside-specific channel-forming protein